MSISSISSIPRDVFRYEIYRLLSFEEFINLRKVNKWFRDMVDGQNDIMLWKKVLKNSPQNRCHISCRWTDVLRKGCGVNLAKYLINKGIDLERWSGVSMALNSGNDELINFFLKDDIRDLSHPMYMAATKGSWKWIYYFENKYKENPGNKYFWSSGFTAACWNGNLDIIKYMIKNGNLENYHTEGLVIGILQSNIEFIEFILSERKDQEILEYGIDRCDFYKKEDLKEYFLNLKWDCRGKYRTKLTSEDLKNIFKN